LFNLYQATPNPWDAAMVVEGWRAANGLPVYEDQITGHATTMYGFAEPYVLGLLFNLLPPTKYVPQVLSLISTAGILVLGVATLRTCFDTKRLVLAGLSLVSLDVVFSYYSSGRPDLPAWLFGFTALWMAYFAHIRQNWWATLFSGTLILVAVSFKQTAAMLVLVPPIAVFLENLVMDRSDWRVKMPDLLRSIVPGALGILYLVALYWLTPQAYYYMVKVPALYDVHIGGFIWMTWRFLAAAACLWLALGTVLLAPRSLGHEWLRRVVWVGTAFIVTLPLSGISAAKFGGSNNSVIPAWLSMTILIWLLLAPKFACFDRSASSKTKPCSSGHIPQISDGATTVQEWPSEVLTRSHVGFVLLRGGSVGLFE